MKTKYWIIVALVAFVVGLASYKFGFLTRNAELVVFIIGVIGAFASLSAIIQKSNGLYLD